MRKYFTKEITQPLKVIILGLALGLGVNVVLATWTGPTATPPGNNVDAPINVGLTEQDKTGSVVIGSDNSAGLTVGPDGVQVPGAKTDLEGNGSSFALLIGKGDTVDQNNDPLGSFVSWSTGDIFGDLNVGNPEGINGVGGNRNSSMYGKLSVIAGQNYDSQHHTLSNPAGSFNVGDSTYPLPTNLTGLTSIIGSLKYTSTTPPVAGQYLQATDSAGDAIWAAGGGGAPGPAGPAGSNGLSINWRGSWSPAPYSQNDAVSLNGNSYICSNSSGCTAFNNPTSSSNWSLMAAAGAAGTVGTNGTNGTNGTSFTWRGTWVAQTYHQNDTVYWTGSSYICSNISGCMVTDQPGSSSNWSLVAQGGTIGSNGTNGTNGTNGNGFTWYGTWTTVGPVGNCWPAGSVVSYQGSTYVAPIPGNGICSPLTPPSQPQWSLMAAAGAAGPAGAAGTNGTNGTNGTSIIWKGAWINSFAYAVNNVVSYNGSAYIAISANTNNTPPGSAWQLLAQAGTNGATGATGATGPQGPAGPSTPGASGVFYTVYSFCNSNCTQTFTSQCPSNFPVAVGGGGSCLANNMIASEPYNVHSNGTWLMGTGWSVECASPTPVTSYAVCSQ